MTIYEFLKEREAQNGDWLVTWCGAYMVLVKDYKLTYSLIGESRIFVASHTYEDLGIGYPIKLVKISPSLFNISTYIEGTPIRFDKIKPPPRDKVVTLSLPRDTQWIVARKTEDFGTSIVDIKTISVP